MGASSSTPMRSNDRKNALFAGCDHGAENWAGIASLVETCKLNGVDPQAYLTDVLTKLVNLWPASRIDELMPWAWARRNAAANGSPQDGRRDQTSLQLPRTRRVPARRRTSRCGRHERHRRADCGSPPRIPTNGFR
jgi:hypothetical protein